MNILPIVACVSDGAFAAQSVALLQVERMFPVRIFTCFKLLTGQKGLLIEQAQELTLLLDLWCTGHLTDTQLHTLVSDAAQHWSQRLHSYTIIHQSFYYCVISHLLGKHHCCYSSNLVQSPITRHSQLSVSFFPYVSTLHLLPWLPIMLHTCFWLDLLLSCVFKPCPLSSSQ